MASTPLSIETIISDSAIRNGQPIIVGTTLRVVDVVAWYVYAGHTPEQLAVGFNLHLGDVFAALAYYHQHKAELDEWMRADAEAAAQLKSELEAKGQVIRFD